MSQLLPNKLSSIFKQPLAGVFSFESMCSFIDLHKLNYNCCVACLRVSDRCGTTASVDRTATVTAKQTVKSWEILTARGHLGKHLLSQLTSHIQVANIYLTKLIDVYD